MGLRAMSFPRPWSLWLAGSGLLLILMWFGMAGVRYEGQNEFSSLTTAGWYVLGFPCIAVSAAIYGAFFAFVARKKGYWTGWIALLAVTLPLLTVVIRFSLPRQRIQLILGSEAAKIAKVESYQEVDSFNDGTSFCGIVSGSERVLDLVIQHRDLRRESGVSLAGFQSAFRKESFPDFGDVYRDQRSSFYRDQATGRIYFVRSLPGRR